MIEFLANVARAVIRSALTGIAFFFGVAFLVIAAVALIFGYFVLAFGLGLFGIGLLFYVAASFLAPVQEIAAAAEKLGPDTDAEGSTDADHRD